MKRFIPFKLRRFLRRLENAIRHHLQPWLYQLWIIKYDRRPRLPQDKISDDFHIHIAEGCTLAPDALNQIAHVLAEYPDTDLVYTDSDEINALGLRCKPYFKPDWDPYLFLSQDYIEPFYVIRKSAIGNPKNVKHIPHILCHQKSAFKKDGAKPRPTFALPQSLPLVSILIPTKDGLSLLKPCIDSIFAKTSARNFEIIIVNNNSEQPETFEYFKQVQNEQVRVLDYPHPFNYAAINNFAAKAAKGEILLLLNNDIEVLSPNWFDEMLSLVLQKDVGIVGAKLYYPNKTIQHAGIVLGIDGTSRHILTGLKSDNPGYHGNLQTLHCCSAVTAACLMIHKAFYESVQGLDEDLFPVTFNDIDLCLKVGKLGYRIVWTPYAEFYHKESATRGEDISPEKRERTLKETKHFLNKWGSVLQNDPFYNPNLSLKSTDYVLAFPPREKKHDAKR